MKNICIFLFFLLLPARLLGQESYKQFLAEGRVWKYSYHAMNGNTYNKYLTVKGDTQIDTKSYKKIVDEETGSYECAMREEGSKVYCSQNGNEFLVYDFGLNVGDTFETSNVNATVVAVKDILVGGRSFRVLDVRDNDTNISNWWVEGIGGMNYLTNSIRVPGDNYTFLQCQLGEEVLFSQQDFLTLPDLFAQEHEYILFVEEGKSWYLGYFHSDGHYPITPEDPAGEGIDCIFTMQGDTEINGKTYKNVYCQFKEYYGDEDLHYYCAVREEDYRVYIVEEEATEEKLIYDFSNPGEIVALPFTFNDINFVRTRGGHDSDFLPGQLIYSVCTSSGDEIDYSHDAGTWIEGVGDYIHNPFAFEFSSLIYDKPKLGKNMWVHSCMKDGKYIFNINWTAEISAIEDKMYIENSQQNSPLYDLQGRRLTSQPSKGVFIKNGKKVVIK